MVDCQEKRLKHYSLEAHHGTGLQTTRQPLYEYVREREQYQKYADQIDDSSLREAQLETNMNSIDGIPGLDQPSV